MTIYLVLLSAQRLNNFRVFEENALGVGAGKVSGRGIKQVCGLQEDQKSDFHLT